MRAGRDGLALCAGALLVVSCAGVTARPDRPTPEPDPSLDEARFDAGLQSLVAAERAFADDAREQGLRAAFLRWLAVDATGFFPGPTAARPVYEGMEAEGQPLLEWAPARVESAAAGDLGLQTGPWRLTEPGADGPRRRGDYLSLWRREGAGPWRVLVDLGTSSVAPRPLPQRATGRRSSVSVRARPSQGPELVDGLERGLADLAAREGGIAALRSRAAGDVHLLREGAPGRNGHRWIATLDAATESKPWIPTLSGQVVSASCDLAAGWGIQQAVDGPERSAFLRVWRREDTGWVLIVDARLGLESD